METLTKELALKVSFIRISLCRHSINFPSYLLIIFLPNKMLFVLIFTFQLQVKVGKEKQDFEQGEEIRLTCSVTGYPIPSIMWYRNNIPLQKSTRFNVDDQDNTLVITKTSTIDTGSYSCRYAPCLGSNHF